jgi:uncharacterized protein YkwD
LVFAGKPVDYVEKQEEALEYINEIRENMGLPLLELGPFLNKAAENHANYIDLLLHRVRHDEEEGKKGFTGVEPKDRALFVGYPKQYNGFDGVPEIISRL